MLGDLDQVPGGGLSHSWVSSAEVAAACPYGEGQWQESWVTTEHLCCAGHAADTGEEHNQEEGVGWAYAPDGKREGHLQEVRWQGKRDGDKSVASRGQHAEEGVFQCKKSWAAVEGGASRESIKLCPAKRYVHPLSPSIRECDLI